MVGPEEYMDDRQQRILASLQMKRPELADLYRTALMLLSGHLRVPGARTRVAFIGHCMREVMNRVLASMGQPPAPKSKPSSGDLIKDLPDLLARHPEMELDREGGPVPVPQEVADAMAKLFKAAISEKRRIRDDVASLITDDDNASNVAVSHWMESRRYFVKWAHLHEQDVSDNELPTNDEIREHLGVFEELIDGVITAFFATRHSIDDLLAEINAVKTETGGCYSVPTPDRVRAALLKIPTYQLRRVFYEGLENPFWVRPLSDQQAFAHPPDLQHMSPERYMSPERLRDAYWPELSYLTRIAPQAPDDVVDVVLGLQESNNVWVRRAVIEIGSQIPAKSSVRLEPLLRTWAQSGFGWRTEPRSLVSFAVNLLKNGQPQLGRWLANKLFEPQPDNDPENFHNPVLLPEEYWFEEELPRMVLALHETALRALAGWLTAFVKSSEHSSNDQDSSAMIRSSIAERDDYSDGQEDALIDAVRDLALATVRSEPEETIGVLLSTNVKLLRKIAMFVLAEAIRQELDAGGDAKAILNVTRRLMDDQESYDECLRVEYARLAQAAVRADASSTSVVTPFLTRAFEADIAWMSEHLPRPKGCTDQQWNNNIQATAQRTRHRWLSAIGHEALPADLREDLAKLDHASGAIHDPLEPVGRITSWTGPNPHTHHDEMATLAPAELVAHLANWHDEGDGWGPEPTHEGQGRELSSLLTTHPLALKGVPQLGKQLRPTYLRAILRGWQAATKADIELDWPQVVELAEYVLSHPLASAFPVEGGDMDDDKDFGGAKGAAIG